ncbi:transposase [Sphaerisporangium fuscum]|uniref:transposase n=1 Tax=Sphaerisporangium fuscum TaxID=2835868 RepID=UPI001BDD6FBF
MALKDYSEEFKADAVAFMSPPGATYKGIAADLGVSRGSLRAWVLRAPSAVRSRSGRRPARIPGAPGSPLGRVTKLRSVSGSWKAACVSWRPARRSSPPNVTFFAQRPNISPGETHW